MTGQRARASAKDKGCCIAGSRRCCNERTSGTCRDETAPPISFALRNDVEDKERIWRALEQANDNRSLAAELLGIGRTTLYSKLEEYGLKYKFRQP